MNLLNPLTSLTWNSLFRRSGRRLRRRANGNAQLARFAAEVLEQRTLLTVSNVNLTVAAGAITLTASDTNNHSIDVHRVGATNNVEFDVFSGTQITYLGVIHTTAFTVAIPTVASVTVNLGGGYDTYDIYDLSTLGNIAFKGTTETGANLNVYSSSSAVTIGGSVIFNVGAQTGAGTSYEEVYANSSSNLTVNGGVSVTQSGAEASDFYLNTNGSGKVLVKGNVTTNQSGAGNKYAYIYTEGTGNVTVNGAVSLTDSGAGYHENDIYTDGTGNVKVGMAVTINDTGSGGNYDRVYTNAAGSITVGTNVNFSETASGGGYEDAYVYTSSAGTGSITVGGSIAINASNSATAYNYNKVYSNSSGSIAVTGSITIKTNNSGSDYTRNYVYTNSSGNLDVGGSIGITDGGSQLQYNYVYTNGSGNVGVTGGVSFTGTGSGAHYNDLYTNGSGQITVGAGVTVMESGSAEADTYIYTEAGSSSITIGISVNITDSGAGDHYNEIYAEADSAPILIKGSVSVHNSGSGYSEFDVDNDGYADSPITIKGSVFYGNGANTLGHSHVAIYGDTAEENAIVTIGGTLTLNLSQASDVSGHNYVYLGEDAASLGLGYGLVVTGATAITGGPGMDWVYLEEGQFTGAVTIKTGNNPGPTHADYLEIDGSEFDAAVFVSMLGNSADIEINDGDGHQTTEFKKLVTINMTGPNATIYVAYSIGPGYSLVKFDGAIKVTGGAGGTPAGTYYDFNATYALGAPTLTNFAHGP